MLWKKVVLWHFHVIKLKMIWHCVLASQKASCTPGFIKQAWPTCWGRWSSPSAPLLWAQTYSIVFSSWVSRMRLWAAYGWGVGTRWLLAQAFLWRDSMKALWIYSKARYSVQKVLLTFLTITTSLTELL